MLRTSLNLYGTGLVLFFVSIAGCKAAKIDAGAQTATAENIADPTLSPNPSDSLTCNACHGSNTNDAPPKDLMGLSDTTLRGTGAHAKHMVDGPLRVAVKCNECHLIPSNVSSVGHIDTDRPAEVIFGDLSATGGLGPTWDPTALTCSGVYCHGASKGGGTNTTPIWTQVDGTQSTCGSCHGLPPPAPHPANTNCASCHGMVVNADNTSIKDTTLHINGVVDVVEDTASCNTCHGSATSNAPPKDTLGNMVATIRGVGAHEAHLNAAGTISAATDCTECHMVPATTLATGHIDTPLPAELVFGNLASTGSATPTWNGTTCGSNYCHGAFNGGANASPTWTNTTNMSCTSCHANPPLTTHQVTDTNCALCHGAVINTDNVTIKNKNLHINGVVEATSLVACNSCHGSNANNAPPFASNHTDQATTVRGVGAHQTHLNPNGTISSPTKCTECHVVPATASAPGHTDTALPAEVIFSTLSKTGGATPTWNTNTLTCTNSYCHGKFTGGANASPVWTTVNGTQAACGTCHALPPPAPHPSNPNCAECHGAVVNADNTTFKNKSLHVNGVVNVTSGGACNSCHGSATNNAPPKDTTGNTTTSTRSVGAHQAHLTNGTMHLAFGCTTCHTVPGAVNAPGHNDTPLPAELTFSTLAKTGGVTPVWNGTTCTSSYCHGNFTGGLNASPAWTTVNGTQAACGSCHALSPATGDHRRSAHVNLPCSDCHGANYSKTAVRLAAHVNGIKDVGGSGSRITTWTKPSCTPTCHGRETW